MSGLKRDLVERRLWIVVAVLVAAVVAVPFLLSGHGDASAGTIVEPPVSAAAGTPAVGRSGAHSGSAEATSAHAKSAASLSAAIRHAATTRNPFAPVTSSTSTSASTTSTTSAATDATTSAATDATTSAPTDGTSTTGVSSTYAEGTGGVEPTTETETVTVTATSPMTPTTTTATAAAATTPPPAGDGPWTVYAVSAAVGLSSHVKTVSNIARLTPLPSVSSPKVMFTGVFDHGHQAVFALGDGVHAVGSGRCRPSEADCAAIALAPGRVEQLSWFASDGATVTQYLADRITPIKVDSRAAAGEAFARFSTAGQCELDLANPVTYDATRGTDSETTKAACAGVRHAVPFPGPLNGS